MIENFTLAFETAANDEGLCIRATLHEVKSIAHCAAVHHHIIPYQQLAATGMGASALIANVKRDLVRTLSVQMFPEV